jgi:hypothetical protein
MIKIAIFVEGQTERIFLRNLFRYCDQKVKTQEISPRGMGFLSSVDQYDEPDLDCLILIVECPSVEKILSYTCDTAEKLIKHYSYTKVIALRDLIPNKRKEKGQILDAMEQAIEKIPCGDRVKVVLAVMETEAWFIYDSAMFGRIDSKLTTDFIQRELGFDLINTDPESYAKPHEVLDKILSFTGVGYGKHLSEVERIVQNLDFPTLLGTQGKIDSFRIFLKEVDCCFA